VDPWAHFNTGKEVCIPDSYSKPSWKVQTFHRATFSANASGTAVLIVDPFRAMFSDLVSIKHTVGSSTGSTLSALANSTGVNARAPFVSTSSPHIEARMVGCGIRVKYIGKYLDTAGIMGVAQRNGVQDDLGTLSTGGLLSRPDCVRTAVTHGGKWTQLAYRPSEVTDTDPIHHTGSATGVMAVVVEGAAASASYEYEVCFFHEYIASDTDIIPGSTQSHTDLMGVSAIRSFVNKVWNSPITANLYNQGMDYVYNYLTKDILAVTGGYAGAYAPLLMGAK